MTPGMMKTTTRRQFLTRVGEGLLAAGCATVLVSIPFGSTFEEAFRPPVRQTLAGYGRENFFVSNGGELLSGVGVRLQMLNDVPIPTQANPEEPHDVFIPRTGFSMQLNCYPVANKEVALIQFAIVITSAAEGSSTNVFSVLNAWEPTFTRQPGMAINQFAAEIPNPMPTGFSFDISLLYDHRGNVTGWTSRLSNSSGETYLGGEFTTFLDGENTSSMQRLTSPDLITPVPINAYTVNVVGSGGYLYSRFTGNTKMRLLYRNDSYSFLFLGPFLTFTPKLPNWASTVTFDKNGKEHNQITGEDSNLYIYNVSNAQKGWDFEQLLAGNPINNQQLQTLLKLSSTTC